MKSRTKKRLIALGLVLALGAGGAVGLRQIGTMRRAQSIVEARGRGMTAYDEGRWVDAMSDLGYFVNRGGRSDAEALYRLADARQRVVEDDGSHVTRAIRTAIDAQAADPSRQDVRRLLLDLYRRAGMFPEAMSTIDKMLEVAPQDRNLLEERIRLFAGLGRWEEAARAAEALAVQFPKDARAHRMAIRARFAGGSQTAQRVRDYLDTLPGALGEGTDLHVVLAEARMGLDDAEGALTEAQAALASGIQTPDQLEWLLPVLDVLGGYRAEAAELAPTLVAELISREDLSPELGRVLVARAWRMNQSASVARTVADALASPADRSDATLGWAVLAAGPEMREQAGGARGVLAARTGPDAAFWNAALRAAEALASTPSEASPLAHEAGAFASALDLDRRTERDLAGYLVASADRLAGSRDAAEDALAHLARVPGWRNARADYISLLIERGQFQTALTTVQFPGDPDPNFSRTGMGAMLGAAALVGLAEQSSEPSPDGVRAAEVLDQIARAGVETPQLLGLLARAPAAAGDEAAASAAIDRLAAAAEEATITNLTSTASALRLRMPEGADRLLAMAEARDADHPDLLFQRAMAAAIGGRVDEGRVILESAAQRASGEQRLNLRRMAARLLDAAGDAGAAEALTALAQANPDSLAVQQDVLDSRAAWTSEDLVRGSINRMRALTSAESAPWRLHEARRLLAFGESGQAKARASESLTVVLDPLLRAGDAPRAFELAATAWLILQNREQAIQSLIRASDQGGNPATIYPRLISLLMQAGRIDEARSRLLAFVQMGEVGTAVGRQRAEQLEQFAMWDEAVRQREALASGGSEQDSIALANLYSRTGRAGDARAVFGRLLESEQPSRPLIVGAATFLGTQDDVGGGVALFERLVGAIPEGERVLLVGDYLKAVGRADQARQVVDAYAQDPRGGAADPEVWLWLAHARFENAQRDEGLAAIDRGLSLDPEFAPLLALRRLDAEGVTDPELLAAFGFDEADEAIDPVVRELNQAAIAFAQDRITFAQMQERLVAITTRQPTFLRAWLMLARLRFHFGDTEGAARAAADAMRLIPGDPRPAAAAAEVLGAMGRLDDAMVAARAWHDRSPGDTLDADMAIAGIHLLANRPAEALAVLNEWKSEILSRPSPTLVQASTLAAALGAGGPSRELDQILAKATDSAIWARAGLDAASRMTDLARRRDWLTRLGRSSALEDADVLDLAFAWRELGAASGQGADLEAALTLLGSRRWPADLATRASLDRAMTLRRLGRLDEAMREYLAAAEASPAASLDARTGLVVMVLEDDPSRASDIVPVARALADQVSADSTLSADRKVIALELLGRCLLEAGQPTEAIAALDRGLSVSAGNPALLVRKAQAHLVAGNRDAAGAAIDVLSDRNDQIDAMLVVAGRLPESATSDVEWLYTRAHERDPDNYLASNNLAYHRLTHGGDPAAAAALAQRAVDSARLRDGRPATMAAVYETLGACLLGAGDAASAERAFNDGLRAQPDAPALLLGLADALHAQGRQEDAQRTFGRIDEAGRASLSPPQRARYETLAGVLDR